MTNPNLRANLEKAREIINAEIDRQLAMWGESNERADATEGQLFGAGLAQFQSTYVKIATGVWPGMPDVYPEGWGGFRDYGSNVANMAVGVAYITNEMARRIGLGESTYRAPRTTADPKYGDTPNVIDETVAAGLPATGPGTV